MDALDDPAVREVYVQAAPQTIKTQGAINYIMRRIDQQPTTCMYIMPDEKRVRRIMRKRLLPTIRKTTRTAELLSDRLDETTTLDVQFINGMNLFVAWASSPSALSSDAVEIIILDEMDKYPPPTGAEPESLSLAEQRTNAYPHTYKIYGCSTPTDEHGAIVRAIRERADEVRYYEAKCPGCGEYQRMLWENIHWGETRDPKEVLRRNLAYYQCPHCNMNWDDAARDIAVRNGRWRAENPVERPLVIGFILPSWYIQPLAKPVAVFLRGLEDREALRAWVTQHCAEPFLEATSKKTDITILNRKSIYPPLIVPPEAIALTAGVDMQKYGFWFVVRAWAEDLTSWLIQYGQLQTFRDVETLLYDTAYHVYNSDRMMKIWRMGIDTGGGESPDGDWSRTEEAYEWLRNQPPGRVYGTKGSSHKYAMVKKIKVSRIDTLPSSNKIIPGGLELRIIDVDAYKELIHWRLERKDADTEKGTPAESQRFYIHAETGNDYVRQLLSEERHRDRRNVVSWKKVFWQNHLLDCEVIAAACADNEWLPSLKMVAAYIKTQKERKEQTIEKNKHEQKIKIERW